MNPEVWLRGPVPGVSPALMPVVHALLQAREDLEREVADVSLAELWLRPGGAASLGFHVRHMAGSIDRLLTYASGRALTEEQRRALALEAEPGDPPADAQALLALARDTIDGALQTIHTLQDGDLLAERFVGRARLPSNTLGLLFHVAEHTTRHVGQFITTKKVIRGLQLADRS